jgi:eukaryotic-like serine/threonine-protein kinase
MTTDAPPSVFGRYTVLGVLGRGAMGVVYRAHDPALDRDVAIKVVTTELLGAEERADYLERFRREARAAARCTHRGIVAVFDFSEAGGNPFIVMELVDGVELGRVIRERGKLPVTEAVALMTQMLDALGHAHALGIVHRDVKPANVLVLPDAEVKIADFGVARLGDISGTQVGMVIGTPKYMAPEQALGGTIDHRADLFAAAAIFYEMLAGNPPFAGATPDEIMARVIHGEPTGLDEAETRAYPLLLPVLRRALSKAAEHRFQSAEEFAAALNRALAGAGVPDDSTRIASRAQAVDARTVEAAEKALATHIGPIAKLVVKKAAGTATSEMELYEALAGNIPDGAARTAFLRRGSASTAREGQGEATATEPRVAPPRRAPVAPEAMKAAQEALTFFVGPIARVLVRKAAEQAGTEAEFYEQLQTHLAREEDKAAFRRRLRKDWDPRLVR